MPRTTTAARTNKASATAKKRANIEVPKGWKVTKGGNRDTLSSKTKDSKSEKGFQLAIERMQIANSKKVWEHSTLMKKTDDELARIAKLELQATNAGIKFVSDYKTLKELYNSQLSHLTKEIFEVDADNQIKKFIQKARSEVTTAQRAVITEYYKGKANRDYSIVDNVYKLLKHKGVMKENTPTTESQLNKEAEKIALEAINKIKEAKERKGEPANVSE